MRSPVLRSAATAAAAALLAAAAPRAAHAQLPPYMPPALPPRTTPPPRPTRAVSVSPVLVLFGSAAGDYEQRAGEHLTVGAGAQYDDKNSILFGGNSGYDFDASVKLRYYPTSPALDGPSIGLVVGGTRYQRARTGSSDLFGEPARTHSVPTAGFTFDYNRLLGAEKHFLLGTGVGVKRRFVRHDRGFDDITAVRPTLRLAFGYAW